MIKLSTLVLVTVFLVAGSNLRAEEITGWINDIDHDSDLVILNDGWIFSLSDDINVAHLTEGMRVRVTYENLDGGKIITGIAPAQPDPQPAEHGLGRQRTMICPVGNVAATELTGANLLGEPQNLGERTGKRFRPRVREGRRSNINLRPPAKFN